MARSPASRKYQLTINNPVAHGLTHECIKEIIIGFTGLEYWCMCDEVGKEGTPHTHVYVVSKNAIMFSTLQKRFYGAHIEPANGSNQENRDLYRVYPELCVNSKLAQNRARIILGRKTAVRDSALAAS